MENREQVVTDYFKLRVLLNKANLRSNQKTEVDFKIAKATKGLVLLATLAGAHKAPLLELCRWDPRNKWRTSGYSGLFALEEYCQRFLDAATDENPPFNELKRLALELKTDLRSLGIIK